MAKAAPTKRQQWKAMHPDLARLADAAIVRLEKRPFTPPMQADKDYAFAPPYTGERDKLRWWALFFEALGTRQESVVTMFFRQLEELVDRTYNHEWEQWVANEEQMIAAFALIGSLKPRNIAEAALAAQLFALHLSNMRLAKAATRYAHGDARTAGTLARAIRAYGDGLMTMKRLKGRGNNSRQTIKVEKRINYVQQVNNYGRGGSRNGGQPHEAADAEGATELRSLPSPHEGGELVPLPGDEGQARLSNPRRSKSRRSSGASERHVETRRMDERSDSRPA